MAGITLATAEAKLQTWLDADEKVSGAQAYRIGERQFTRADLGEIRQQIQFWQNQVDRLSTAGRGSGMRLRGITVAR